MMIFSGIVRDGRFCAEPLSPWLVWLGAHNTQRVVISADTVKVHRSLAQNRRYWSLVVPVAAEVLNTGRAVPLSKDQIHEVLKGAFIGWEETPLGKTPKSSKVLNTEQFAAFCREAEAWLLQTWGVVLPERESE